MVPSPYYLPRGDPDYLEPLHHHVPRKLYSSGCGGNEGWGVHETVSGDEICEGVSARFQQSRSLNTKGTGARATFNAYISDCLTQENNNNNYSASKSRKRAFEAGSSQSRHQWQGDSSIVLLPQVLGSDHRREGTPGIQRSRSRTRWR